MRQAEIASRLGVTRNWINQLRNEEGFPDPVRPLRWDLGQVRSYLRQRAIRNKPGASFCATCGGSLT
jgi:transcriptional regulator with XRE-family HTH domain